MESARKRVIPFTTVEKCESTNSWIKDNCASLPHYYTLRAIEQSGGRGRFDRSWIASVGDDLTFSTLVPVTDALKKVLIHTPQLTALAVYKVLVRHGVDANIKWPNDLLVNQKKICGILAEGVYSGSDHFLVVGIGLNVNSSIASANTTPATSIFLETGEQLDIDLLMQEITNTLYELLDTLCEDGFSRYAEMLDTLLAYKGETRLITINDVQKLYEIVGINRDGALVLRDSEGDLHSIISGEISFRS